MTYVEEGTQGAFRQTWRKGNPRSLLKTIMEKNPNLNPGALYNIFWQEIEDDKEILRNIAGYWLDHNYQSLKAAAEPQQKPTTSSSSPPEKEPSSGERLRRRIQYETRIILLELIMPNDKRLADCTGAECGKFGGWLFALSKKVPTNKTVGTTLTEDEVYQLWQQAKNYRPKK